MGSDRARVSFDEGRHYRSVVAQQGRVTLEADVNEAWTIAEEERAERFLDVIGPAGTPDDGYRVTAAPAGSDPHDFLVTDGTMYVGGVRAVADQDIAYSGQDEWLDHSSDPDWVAPTDPVAGGGNELVWLWLSDTEVGAVEDRALRDVALGGPDTAQRRRLVQRIKRLGTDAAECEAAFQDLADALAAQGLHLDLDTRRVRPDVTLEVSFPPAPPNPDLCEPEAAGGYLEADNQLIRVMVTRWDGSTGKLVWGFDNASFLYRVTPVNAQTIELQSRPVDAEHQPAAGQAVEVLRSAAVLSTQDYVAADMGVVKTLALAYNPDTQRIALSTALPADYVDTAKTPALFLRVWQQEVTFTPGIPLTLGTTGVQVTLDAPTGKTFAPGAYWMFAVRPSTPQKVYPERYLVAPQPAEGPVLWATPLAVLSGGQKFQVLDDCREHFVDLVELTRRRTGGCCDVMVTPQTVRKGRDLPALIDRYKGQRVTICLRPGRYELREPIRLGPRHDGLTLEGCHDGVVITAAKGSEQNFVDGLVVLDRAENVTISGIRFLLPRVPLTAAKAELGGRTFSSLRRTVGRRIEDLDFSVGIRPLHAAMMTVRNCLFRFTLTQDRDLFGAGIFAGSECWGHHVEDCRFLRDEEYLRDDKDDKRDDRDDVRDDRDRPFRMLFGYLLAPSMAIVQEERDGRKKRSRKSVPSLLAESSFLDNRFTGLAAAVTAIGDFGPLRIDDNTVLESDSGFMLLSGRGFVAGRQVSDAKKHPTMRSTGSMVGLSLARAYPLPQGFVPDDDEDRDAEVMAANVVQAYGGEMVRRLVQAEMQRESGAVHHPRVGTPQPGSGFDKLADDADAVDAERFDKPAAVTRGFRLQLHVGDNEVDAYVPGGTSGRALLVMDDLEDTASDVVVVGNRMRSTGDDATATVWFVDRGSVTGNTIANEDGPSLEVEAGTSQDRDDQRERVAITGNLFKGSTALPRRPHPSPMDNWEILNAHL